jgi:hypothetical protein
MLAWNTERVSERSPGSSLAHSPEHLLGRWAEHLAAKLAERRSDCRRGLSPKPARASLPGLLWLAALGAPLRRRSAGESASRFHPGLGQRRSFQTLMAQTRRDSSLRHFWTIEDRKQLRRSNRHSDSWWANYSRMKRRSVTSRPQSCRRWTNFEHWPNQCRLKVAPQPRVEISFESPDAPHCRFPAMGPQR